MSETHFFFIFCFEKNCFLYLRSIRIFAPKIVDTRYQYNFLTICWNSLHNFSKVAIFARISSYMDLFPIYFFGRFFPFVAIDPVMLPKFASANPPHYSDNQGCPKLPKPPCSLKIGWPLNTEVPIPGK